MKTRKLPILATAICLATLAPIASAQSTVTTTTTTVTSTTNLVVPQWHRVIMPPIHPQPRPMPMPMPGVALEKVDAKVMVKDRAAVTTLTFTLRNPGARPQESVVLAPVPSAAVFRSFSLEGPGGGEMKAELLPRDEARRIYDDIVRRMIDPGLLEFAGTGLVRSSVFPVPPGGTSRARLVYEEILPEDSGRIDYRLPRTEGPGQSVPWSVQIDWSMPGGAVALHCPSHPAVIRTAGESTTLTLDGAMQPGSLCVTAVRASKDAPSLALTCYPPEGGEDGYFLMLLAPPAGANPPALKRELTLVLDRSGSMAGEKLDQAKAAALQIAEGMEDGEGFNIITYNEAVHPLFPAPRGKDAESTAVVREFIRGIKPSGGTNIHDSLIEALRAPATPGKLPVILFLTDGLPTVGETLEKRIRENVRAVNTGNRRIFSFGVGVDVNTPLLSRLADDSRAATAFALPGEDVEMKVLAVFKRLTGPVVASPLLVATTPDGKDLAVNNNLPDVLPNVLPDLFAGDNRVITGRWRSAGPMVVSVRGQGANGMVEAKATLDPASASTANAHVPRLWATRRIAALTDALRDLGADGKLPGANDPKAKELVEEIVKLSLRHGVLSEYTAFLARDGQSFDPRPQAAFGQAMDNVQKRALAPSSRSGMGSMNQEANVAKAKSSASVDKANSYLDAGMKETKAGEVQQLADRTFFKNNGRWTDSRVKGDASTTRVEIGSPEFDKLVDRLVATNRQAMLSLPGDIILEDEGKIWLIPSSNQ